MDLVSVGVYTDYQEGLESAEEYFGVLLTDQYAIFSIDTVNGFEGYVTAGSEHLEDYSKGLYPITLDILFKWGFDGTEPSGLYLFEGDLIEFHYVDREVSKPFGVYIGRYPIGHIREPELTDLSFLPLPWAQIAESSGYDLSS